MAAGTQHATTAATKREQYAATGTKQYREACIAPLHLAPPPRAPELSDAHLGWGEDIYVVTSPAAQRLPITVLEQAKALLEEESPERKRPCG